MFRKETYVRRRSELRKRIEGGLVLLPGNGESPANYPSNQFRFRQDSTFLYFFGLNRPDYVGLMDIDSGEETLYGDDYTIDDIIWMGPQPTLDEQAREVGIGKTLPLSQLGKRIEAAVAKGRKGPFPASLPGRNDAADRPLLGLAPRAGSALRLGRAGQGGRSAARDQGRRRNRPDRKGLRDRQQDAPHGYENVPSGASSSARSPERSRASRCSTEPASRSSRSSASTARRCTTTATRARCSAGV